MTKFLYHIAYLIIAFFIGMVVGIHSALSDSLEVELVRPTPKGPQFTYDSGCYVYSQYWGAIAWERKQGVPLSEQMNRLGQLAKNEKVEGMVTFLHDDVVWIYNLPLQALNVEFNQKRGLIGQSVSIQLNLCREHGGRSWEMRRSM